MKIPSVATNLAQMVVQIRSIGSSLGRAVAVLSDPDTARVSRLAAIAGARISAAQTATVVTRTTHQLHGAVGITREYALHRYTRSLWAQRDADQSEYEWTHRLGAMASAVDEATLWDQLTA